MSAPKDGDSPSAASGTSQSGGGGSPASALPSVVQNVTQPGSSAADGLSQTDSEPPPLPRCSECGEQLGADAASCEVCALILSPQHLPVGCHHDNRPDRMTPDGAPLCTAGGGVFAPTSLAILAPPPAATTAPLPPTLGLTPALVRQLQGLGATADLQRLLSTFLQPGNPTGCSFSGLSTTPPPVILLPPLVLETCLLCKEQQPMHVVKAVATGGFQCVDLQACTSRPLQKATQQIAAPAPAPPPPPPPSIYPDQQSPGTVLLRGHGDRVQFLLGLTNVTRFGVPPTRYSCEFRTEFNVASPLQAKLAWVSGRLSASGPEARQILEQIETEMHSEDPYRCLGRPVAMSWNVKTGCRKGACGACFLEKSEKSEK